MISRRQTQIYNPKGQCMRVTLLITLLFFSTISFAQNPDSLYSLSMDAYDDKDYALSAKYFSELIIVKGFDMSNRRLYNGACSFALNGDIQQSLKILEYLAKEKFYSNLSHIQSDGDLITLHDSQRWKTLLTTIAANKESEPKRNRVMITKELMAARKILQVDAGNLWGIPLWNDKLLVIDYDFTVHTFKKLDNANQDSLLYYKPVIDDSLSFTNTTQQFEGEEYATVVLHAVDDSSSTIIHELFHLAHLKDQTLRADPVTYLDDYEARVLLRLEYQALRNALRAIDRQEQNQIEQFVNDAFLFRKERQSKYKEYLQSELELETVEGLANYTGIILSRYKNKYRQAINEIEFREAAETYTRPFPYATGPAYGLIFDYLKLDWRVGFDDVYNFLEIYESQYLNKPLEFSIADLKSAQLRNNYSDIDHQEQERKAEQQRLTNFYVDLFYDNPTLRVPIPKGYSMTFNMNGTMVLDEKDIVYSWLKGEATDKSQFGSFTTLPGKDQLGSGGILRIEEYNELVFPRPERMDGNKISSFNYEMTLNDGWKLEAVNDRGDMRIIAAATSVQRLRIDVNGDGLIDEACGWYQDSLFVASVKIASEMDDIMERRFSFPLENSEKQHAFCGRDIVMSSEMIDNTPVVKLSDGMCDAIRLMWDAKSEKVGANRN